MAKKLVEFLTRDGKSIIVEVEAADEGTGLAGKGGVVERAKQNFEDAVSMIHPIAEAVIENLRTLANTPDEVNVEFRSQVER